MPRRVVRRGTAAAIRIMASVSFGSSPALGAPLAFFPSTVTLQPTTPLPTAFPQLSHYKALFRAQSARGPPV